MDDHDVTIRGILKQSGLKYSKQRASIMEIMAASGQPLSADHVFLVLREKGIEANLSTVYRTLESLAAKGIAIKSSIGSDTKASFELSSPEHRHHIICMGCKKMMTIDGCPLDEYEKLLREKLGFDVTGHKLEIYGYCESCRNKDKGPSDTNKQGK